MVRNVLALSFVGLFASTLPAQTPDRFAPAIAELTKLIEHEVKDKKLPALSIAVVDDQRVVWSQGFGEQTKGTPATDRTVYRVGSVSKLFTDVAVMQLVGEGRARPRCPRYHLPARF